MRLAITNQEEREDVMMWVSDLYKDVYGSRPRGYNFEAFSNAELATFVNDLIEEREHEAQMEAAFVEKAIEIGVQEITFVESKRTERSKVKEERIQRIVISAMKQSLKFWAPKINYLTPFKSFLENCSTETRLIAHLNEGERHTVESSVKGKETTILIGPEGDFTDEEVAQAFANGFTPVTLGKSRLRTETAGIFACVQLNLLDL